MGSRTIAAWATHGSASTTSSGTSARRRKARSRAVAADITTAVGLQQSRARLWRYPPHTTGRRHADHAQEEVFVVISGTLTMLLGDEPERVDLGPGSVVAVEPMTALQMRNETDDELVASSTAPRRSRKAPTSWTTSSCRRSS